MYGIEAIEIKCLELQDLLTITNRLTRFEFPINKNNFISRNILFKTSVVPKINNKRLSALLPATVESLVATIWNNSLKNLGYENNSDYMLNLYLAYEDTKIFSPSECLRELFLSERSINLGHPLSINSFTDLTNPSSHVVEEIKSLLTDNAFNIGIIEDEHLTDLNIFEKLYIAYRLSYPLNIEGFIKLLKRTASSNSDTYPTGITRLIELDNMIKVFENAIPPRQFLKKIYNLSSSLRRKLNIPLPPRLILLVEGITEELLLPKFAELLTYDFNTDGILLISAGGKNQVNKLYSSLKRQVNIPIAILLDADAIEIIEELRLNLRTQDKLLNIENGEFEDLLPKELICKVMNKAFMLSPSLNLSDIDQDKPMTKQLTHIWKDLKLGDFNKSQFANTIVSFMDNSKYISNQMKHIIEEIYSLL